MTDSNFPKIFVVILNFNGALTLPACLNSVFQSDYPNFEIIVVDNDSKDGSFEQAKSSFSRLHFIKNSKNLGFSQGNNVGIRFALEKFADYIFLLNNDALIKKDTLSLLEKTAKKNLTAGIISPLIMQNNNEDVWFAGGEIQWKKMRAVHIDAVILDKPYLSQYLSGCAMLIRKDVFREIGLFDERFFLYYEDADFSLRAKKANFDLLIDPSIKIKHLEQSNLNNSKTYWLVLSGLLFFNIHATFPQKIWIFIYTTMRKIKNSYKYYFTKDSSAKNVRLAYQDFKKLPK